MLNNDWINKRSRIYWYDQYALNDQEVAFAKYDPDRIVDELCEVGADVVAVYAANQFSVAYYPSEIWPMHLNLKGRDYFGEISSRLKARGKKVIAYVNWLESRHPDWNAIPIGHEDDPFYKEQPLASWADPSDPDKRVQNLPGGSWRSPCYNSPRKDQIAAVAREICSRYQPDALHVDMILSDFCVCPRCRPTLERICGTKDITIDAIHAHWHEFIEWHRENSTRIVREVTTVCKEYGVLTAHNAMAPLFVVPHLCSDEGWLEYIDVFLSECFDAFCVPGTDVNSPSLNVRWQRAMEKPSWILRTSASIHYAHWPVSRTMMELYAAICKANGCKLFGPCGVGAYPDTTSPKKLLENVKHGFDIFMEDADLDEGARPAAKVGLGFSWSTRRHGYNMNWQGELVGWNRLLTEEHIPFEVVIAERVKSVDDLKDFDLIILPGLKDVSKTFCDAVKEYVNCGGRVLATAETSLCDENDAPRVDFMLGDTFGISKQGSTEGSFAIEGKVEPEPAAGIFQEVSTSGNVIYRQYSLDPAGSVGGAKDPFPIAPTKWPVAVKNFFGKGKSIYVAFDVGRYYQMHGDQHIGEFMMDLVNRIYPHRNLVVNAPRTVEATIWEQPHLKRTIVHLVNKTIPWSLPTDTREITEIIPVNDISFSLECKNKGVNVSCRGAEVKRADLNEQKLTVELGQLKTYAAVIIEHT